MSLLSLNTILRSIVNEVNASSLKTMYSYTGDEETHSPIYYEETALFKKMIEQVGLRIEVKEVSDRNFSPSKWDPSTSLLHIPGALSTELDKHLGDKIEEIRDFVFKGGVFLGWCGGSYWACREVSYVTPLETLEKRRNLALWEGAQKGPLLAYQGNPEANIGWFHGAVRIKWTGSEILRKIASNGIELDCLLSGGGAFFPAEEERDHKVLASYSEFPESFRAAVKVVTGNGVSILINPYLTHGAEYLKPGLEAYKKHFPHHGWSEIMGRLDTRENALKAKICFADIFLEATLKSVN